MVNATARQLDKKHRDSLTQDHVSQSKSAVIAIVPESTDEANLTESDHGGDPMESERSMGVSINASTSKI